MKAKKTIRQNLPCTPDRGGGRRPFAARSHHNNHDIICLPSVLCHIGTGEAGALLQVCSPQDAGACSPACHVRASVAATARGCAPTLHSEAGDAIRSHQRVVLGELLATCTQIGGRVS